MLPQADCVTMSAAITAQADAHERTSIEIMGFSLNARRREVLPTTQR
jgi:hypothetical protein